MARSVGAPGLGGDHQRLAGGKSSLQQTGQTPAMDRPPEAPDLFAAQLPAVQVDHHLARESAARTRRARRGWR